MLSTKKNWKIIITTIIIALMSIQIAEVANAYLPGPIESIPVTSLTSPSDKIVYASEVSSVTIQWTVRAYDDTPRIYRIYVDGSQVGSDIPWYSGKVITFSLPIDGTFRTYQVICKAYSRSSYDTDTVYVRVRVNRRDEDGDGLTNTIETNLGTGTLNPNDPDWIVESFDQENIGDHPYYDWDNHKGDNIRVDQYPDWEPRPSEDHLLKSTHDNEWIDKDIESYVDAHTTGNDYFYFSFDLAVDWSENENDWFAFKIQLLQDNLLFSDLNLISIVVQQTGVYLSIYAGDPIFPNYNIYPLMPLRDERFNKYEFVIKKCSTEHIVFVWIDGNYFNTYNLLNVAMERIRIEQNKFSDSIIGYVDNIFFGKIENFETEHYSDFNFPVTYIRLYDPPGDYSGCYAEYKLTEERTFELEAGFGHNPQGAAEGTKPILGRNSFGITATGSFQKTYTTTVTTSKSTNPDNNGIDKGDRLLVEKFKGDIDFMVFSITPNYKIGGLTTISNVVSVSVKSSYNLEDFSTHFPGLTPPDPKIGVPSYEKKETFCSADGSLNWEVEWSDEWSVGFEMTIPIPQFPEFEFTASIKYSKSVSESMHIFLEPIDDPLEFYTCFYEGSVINYQNGHEESQFMVVWFEEYH